MANINAAFGLRPTRSLVTYSNTQINEYEHDSGDSTALYIGDAVVTTGDSTSGVTGIPDGTPQVIASGSVTTGSIRGAVVGVRPTLTNLTLQYGAASTSYGVLVCDDPFQLFNIQSDGTVVHGDISGNISLLTGSGSTYTGLSGYQAHEATLGSTNVLREIRLAPIQGNALGANGILEVMINNHELKSTSGT
jgi:hypothetical protein